MATLPPQTRTRPTFASALAEGRDWAEAAKGCLQALGPASGANLGFLYVTDHLADQLGSIITLFRGVTGIDRWVGTVGVSVCGQGREVFDRPAVSAMLATFPEEAVRLIPSLTEGTGPLDQALGTWLALHAPMLGLVHADPRSSRMMELVEGLAQRTQAFLVGGLTSSRADFPQVSGRVAEEGLSGALFSADVGVITGLTQGCTPIGPVHEVTSAEGGLVAELDGRPALDVFREEIGPELAADLDRTAGRIFAGLPISGSDTGDYLARAVTGIDMARGTITIRGEVDEGDGLMFCRRDQASAVADMDRMLTQLSRRLNAPPRGGIYIGCLARGRHLFGEDGAEMAMIRNRLGDFPLTGFFAAGEISNARLYSQTGVLVLFT